MKELSISASLNIPLDALEIRAIRSQGAGGQHVNKVATGIHLRYDFLNSELPEAVKQRLLQRSDHRISPAGVIVIKAQQSRSQEQNRQQALTSLQLLLRSALSTPKPRKKTRPTRSSKEKRLQNKSRRGQLKALRKSPSD